VISEAVRLEREKRRTMREARAWALVNDPLVVGMATYLVGLYAIEHIPWSPDEDRARNMKMLGQTVNAYVALSRLGVKGWPAALAAGAGGMLATGEASSGGLDLARTGTYTAAGAGIGTLIGTPGVGTAVGAGVGLGIDTVLQTLGW